MLEDYVEGLRVKRVKRPERKGVKNSIRLKCAGDTHVSEGDVGLE